VEGEVTAVASPDSRADRLASLGAFLLAIVCATALYGVGVL
jgi:hypothetical protein